MKAVFVSDKFAHNSLQILSKGRSRVPLYKDGDRKMIVGYILVKNLVNMDPTLETPIRQLNIRRLPNVSAETNLFRMLKHFKKGQSKQCAYLKIYIHRINNAL